MTYSSPEQALKDIFGYDDFRPSQKEIIEANLDGRDGLAIMATGGGKSLCYQIPALMKKGTALVVSPLIALMKDQVDTLTKKGVVAACFYHEQPVDEKLHYANLIKNGKAKFIYTSPERLESEEFFEDLKYIDISFVAIDEAHCASVWGHDFRPAYARIGKNLDRLSQERGQSLQRFAFTATANEATRTDLMRILGIQENSYIYIGGFDRPNIDFEVRQVNNKYEEITDYVSRHPGETTIIYSATIKSAKELHSFMTRKGLDAGLYHGQMKNAERQRIQDSFANGTTKTLIATNAFGMGVDISFIRHSLHLHMPANLENYYQEAGRAGRDGKPSRAVIFFSPNDRGLQEFFIRGNYPEEEVVYAVQAVLSRKDSTKPFILEPNEIVYKASSQIDLNEFKISAALRILEEQGLITMKPSEEDRNRPGIELNEINKDLDLSYLSERRHNSATKLAVMERYCLTRLCRRELLLKYFGEHRKSGVNCGGCDICKNEIAAQNKFSTRLPDEVVDNALKLIAHMPLEENERGLKKLLLGVSSRAQERKLARQGKTPNDIPGFGSLISWSSNDISVLLLQIQEEGLIELDDSGKAKLTTRGDQWLEGSKRPLVARDGLKHRSSGNDGSQNVIEYDNGVENKERHRFLQEWAKSKANELEVAEFMILSRDVIDKLSCCIKVPTEASLKEAGISNAKIGLFGKDLCKDLAEFNKKDRLTKTRSNQEFSP